MFKQLAVYRWWGSDDRSQINNGLIWIPDLTRQISWAHGYMSRKLMMSRPDLPDEVLLGRAMRFWNYHWPGRPMRYWQYLKSIRFIKSNKRLLIFPMVCYVWRFGKNLKDFIPNLSFMFLKIIIYLSRRFFVAYFSGKMISTFTHKYLEMKKLKISIGFQQAEVMWRTGKNILRNWYNLVRHSEDELVNVSIWFIKKRLL